MDLVEARAVKEARSGVETAFLKLFDDHHQPLFRFAFRLTGSIADAEDIVQECFLELLRPASSYDAARAPLRTYLFGTVRNQALKRLRRANPQCPEPVHAVSPETEALVAELRDVVGSAVNQLPDTQKEVLILAHYEQMPLSEIATVLDLELGAVKSRLQRARAALKGTLAVYGQALEKRR